MTVNHLYFCSITILEVSASGFDVVHIQKGPKLLQNYVDFVSEGQRNQQGQSKQTGLSEGLDGHSYYFGKEIGKTS